MAHYVYIISNYNRKHIHAGYCSCVSKMVSFYNELNKSSLNYPPENYLNRLVYFEEVEKEGQAIDRMMYFTFMPLSHKIKEIEAVNPEWFDLTAVPNYPF